MIARVKSLIRMLNPVLNRLTTVLDTVCPIACNFSSGV
jgi:hypothetical protein